MGVLLLLSFRVFGVLLMVPECAGVLLLLPPRVAVVLLLLPLWVVGGASAGAPVCGGGAPAASPVQCTWVVWVLLLLPLRE